MKNKIEEQNQPKNRLLAPENRVDEEIGETELDNVSGGFNIVAAPFSKYDKLVYYAYPFVFPPRE